LANEEDIPIIIGKQGSAGIEYKKKGWLFSGEGYYKYVNGITTRSQGFLDQNQAVNATGSYQVSGAEVLINKRSSKYSIWLTYTLAKNDYTFDDLEPATFPNSSDIRHSISFAGSYTYRKLKLSVCLITEVALLLRYLRRATPLMKTRFLLRSIMHDPTGLTWKII
jgi:hypothetical protein